MKHLASLAVFFVAISTKVQAEPLVGLTATNQLIRFSSSAPAIIASTVSLSGLAAGDSIVGIDVRPANNTLYGFAINGSVGRVYSINVASGVATLSATLSADPADMTAPTPYAGVSGDFFGVDFNPVADRLRVVSDSGQSLRINVQTGLTQLDGSLAYAAADPNTGTTPAVVAAAYTNSVAAAASTVLYDLDASISALVTQNPPNTGTLNTVALLGAGVTADAAFDISGQSGIAYAVLDGSTLTSINLADGAVTELGTIGSIAALEDLAVIVPEPTGLAMGLAIAVLATRGRGAVRRRGELT